MATAQMRAADKPAIFSYGFRPFFLLGSLWGALAMLVWLPMLSGRLETASLFSPVDWHAHELLFGYLPAIIAGFLLTAIANWTGRPPARGGLLVLLVLLWLAGRFAIWFSAGIGWTAAMAVSSAFLLALAATADNEIVAARNWRNLKVLAPVLVLFAADVLFHVEAQAYGVTDVSRRLGLAAAIVFIMIIGGRIVPAFTRNWLQREKPGRMPVQFDRLDMAAAVVSVAALAAWTFWPDRPQTAIALLLAAIGNLVRLARWAGDRTLRNPLLVVLHVAFLFVPAGMIVSGLGAIDPAMMPAVAGIHVFGVGAIGTMTLAVMARATLGHTGHALRAGPGTSLVFCAIVLSAPLRFAAALMPDATWLLHASATLWIAAFIGFLGLYAGPLIRPRRR